MNRGVLYYPKGPDQLLPVGVMGQSRGLIVRSDVTSPNTVVQVTADEVLLKAGDGRLLLVLDVNVSGNITKSGPGGLDAATEAVSTWYYVWLISNGTDLAVVLSTKATEVNMMFGYEFRALVGATFNDAGGNLVKLFQTGARAHVIPTEVTVITPGGDVSLAALVPPTARTVFGSAYAVHVASNTTIAVTLAANSDGVGKITALLGNNAATRLNSMYVEIPMSTPQTVHILVPFAAGSAGMQLAVAGFTL